MVTGNFVINCKAEPYSVYCIPMRRVRTIVYLDASQRKALKAESGKHGATLGELIRRAVAEYIKKIKSC